jgi:transcription initiation factor TFIIIB Brf1 subunit/transcription initiation factor TFIIB
MLLLKVIYQLERILWDLLPQFFIYQVRLMDITISSFAQAAGVTEVTIRNISRDLRNHLDLNWGERTWA